MSSSHKILGVETEILHIMEKSLKNLPTPPNREKKNLLKEIKHLEKKIDKTLRSFDASTAMLIDRFLTLSKSEMEQAEQAIRQKVKEATDKLESPVHLQQLTQRLEKQTAAFQRSKHAHTPHNADKDQPSLHLNRIFRLQALPKKPKVKTLPLETRRPSSRGA